MSDVYIKDIIEKFDEFLVAHGVSFEGIAVGGAALILLGVTDRKTRDVDLLNDEIPLDVTRLAKEFAAKQGLPENWLNNGPSDLTQYLPAHWIARTVPLFSGKALMLRALGRTDLLKTKVWAFCDRPGDLADIVALNPSPAELLDALCWVKPLDANPSWPEFVERVGKEIEKAIGISHAKY